MKSSILKSIKRQNSKLITCNLKNNNIKKLLYIPSKGVISRRTEHHKRVEEMLTKNIMFEIDPHVR